MKETKVKVIVADPSALGLFGLAMVTLVASSQKLGSHLMSRWYYHGQSF